jgi:hypothetical protein
MTLQSCILLGVTLYDYISVANANQLAYTDFVTISHRGAYSHQKGEFTWALHVFLFSKLWEWIDTILLVINKKKVIPLHWWHHSTITWAFYTGFYSSSVYTIAFLNSFIHIIMYLYYAEVKMIQPYAKYLTSLQIIQLFSGVYMNTLSYFYHTESRYKLFSLINGFICLSYGCMFLQFFQKKYSKNKKNVEKNNL